jgi:sortase (surface protein transpeptidase)
MLKHLTASGARRFNRPARVVLAIVAGIGLAAAGLHVVPFGGQSPRAVRRPSVPPKVARGPLQTPVPRGAATSTAPERLKIPALGVDARIEYVGLTPEGNMDVPRDVRDVGWYAPGVRPGQPGDAVIAGHLDWSSGPAVFWRLSWLRAGDIVDVLYADGTNLTFRVQRLASYAYDQPPPDLFSPDGPTRLSLITCAGSWDGQTYRQRLVVDAVLSSEGAAHAAT